MTNFTKWIEDYKSYTEQTILISKQAYKDFWELSSNERQQGIKNYLNKKGTSQTAYETYQRASYKAYQNGTTLEQEVAAHAQEQAEAYKREIEKKVENHVGNIIEWEQGNMEYIVHGDKGKAKVEAIYAGGYNIQRLHIRVIVRKLK